MKRISIYILAALTLGMFSSCVRDRLENSSGEIGGPVRLDVGLVIPGMNSVETRAMFGDAIADGDVEGLLPYIFIFEDTGGGPEDNYLRSLVHGTQQIIMGATGHDDGSSVKCQKFSATVDGTAENAIIHIVLIQPADKDNFEAQLKEMTDRSELGMFTGAAGLYTTMAAYWKRIELNSPISNKTEDKKNVLSKLRHVQMNRNFAQVTMKSDASNFTIAGFVIVNGMDRGYAAAYNESTGTAFNNFVEFEGIQSEVEKTVQGGTPTGTEYYDYLTNTIKYIPARHPLAARLNKDNDPEKWLSAVDLDDEGPKYMFERPIQDTRMTCVLLKGYFNGSNTASFYKLDIGSYDKTPKTSGYNGYGIYKLFNLVRNISYDITITGAASAGHSSPESALAGPPANNITASVQTKDVLQLGDGFDIIGVHIYPFYKNKFETQYLDGTTVVVVDDADGDFDAAKKDKPYPSKIQLRWMYRDGTTTPGSTVDLSTIGSSYTDHDLVTDGIIQSINGSINGGWSWTPFGTNSGDNTNGGNYSWYGCDIVFNEPGDIPLQKTVKLYQPFGLSRDITFILRKRWEFISSDQYPSNIEVYPGWYSFDPDDVTMPAETLDEVRRLIPGPGDVGSMRGAQLTLMFELPSDIPQVLFPLEFKIGFDRQNVDNAYPGNANVVYGDSMFDDQPAMRPDGSEDASGRTEQRMQFIKTVYWEDYNGDGDPGNNGHKIVTARFVTTADVEDNIDVGSKSTTRVRVTNPYFKLGEDSFTRNSKTADPDPKQNMWLWYFGDAGWWDYVTKNPPQVTDGGYEYNGLWFNAYTTGTQHGRYIGMTYGRGENNPDFRFYPNAMVPDGVASATLTVTATSYRYKKDNNNYYRRHVKARIYWEGGSQTDSDGRKYDDHDFGEVTLRDNDDYGRPGNFSWNLPISPGQKIDEIRLWNVSHGGKDDKDDPANTKTLYYGIRFELK